MHILQNILLLAAASCFAAPQALADDLVIIHTNDTHSLIDPDHDGKGGVARRKVLIDSIRNENPDHTLLVDAGDVYQGTLFFNLYYGELEEKLMNALGYDIRILGNHEFDNGMEALAKNLKSAEADLVCTNYQFRGTPLEGIFDRFSIKEIDGKRIAFLGINLQPEGMISKRNFTGMGYTDAIEAANVAAKYLKEIEQVDAVIALSHIGYEDSTPDDRTLARLSSDIDLIIGGHSHTVIDPDKGDLPYIFKNQVGKPVLLAQTGKDGKFIGEIRVNLDSIGIGATPRYKLHSVDSRLDSRLDPKIAEIIAPYRAEVDSLNANYIASVPHDLPHRCTELVNFAADLVEKRGRELDPEPRLRCHQQGRSAPRCA